MRNKHMKLFQDERWDEDVVKFTATVKTEISKTYLDLCIEVAKLKSDELSNFLNCLISEIINYNGPGYASDLLFLSVGDELREYAVNAMEVMLKNRQVTKP